MVLATPIDGEAKIGCTLQVHFTFLILLEYCKKMFGICFVVVHDTKIVNDEGKTNRSPFVSPESWGDCTLFVACFEESLC